MRHLLTVIACIAGLICHGRELLYFNQMTDSVIGKGQSVDLLDGYSYDAPVTGVEAGFMPHDKFGEWSMEIVSDKADTLVVTVKRNDENMMDFDHKLSQRLTCIHNGVTISVTDAERFINRRGKRPNYLRCSNVIGSIEIAFGYPCVIWRTSAPFDGKIGECRLRAASKGTLVRTSIYSKKHKPHPATQIETIKTQTPLDSTVWRFLDIVYESKTLDRGGDYELMLRATPTGYELLYLSGAGVNQQDWTPGDLKASLQNTILPDYFNLTWYDAERYSDYAEAYVQIEGNILSVYLPVEDAKMRFLRTK